MDDSTTDRDYNYAKAIVMASDETSPALESLLDQGYEPFAVTANANSYTIHCRCELDDDDEDDDNDDTLS